MCAARATYTATPVRELKRSSIAKARRSLKKRPARFGLDDTFIVEDGAAGWKISHYIDGCRNLDYHNADEVARALTMIRTLHESGVASPWNFDIFDETCKIVRLLDERSWAAFKDFSTLSKLADSLHSMTVEDAVPACLCHNNFDSSNVLVRDGEMFLIDWEYSGMGDYAGDLGTFVCCSDYGCDEALKVYETYFGRPLTPLELRHCVAYTALSSFYWFVWALYKEACDESVGEWLYLWYKNAKLFGGKALELSASI